MTTNGRAALTHTIDRFETPLYTVADAARIVDVPESTVRSWAKGYVGRPAGRRPVIGEPIVTALPSHRPLEPTIPFVGLAEALVLGAVRRCGVPMQRIRPALRELQRSIGLEHALASQRLFTDGAELLYDYAGSESSADEREAALELVVVRNNQRVFTDMIASYLRRIEYGSDGYASLIHVPAYDRAAVVADPARSFGAPILEHGGARVDDVMQRFLAGDSISELSEEFGVAADEVEDVVRAASRRAA